MTSKNEDISLNDAYVVCPACDAMWDKPALQNDERARCGRCEDVIYEKKSLSWERVKPELLAAIILYVAAIHFPFLGLEEAGLKNEISVINTPGALWASNMHVLAIVVFVFMLAFPILRIGLLIGLIVSLSYFKRSNLSALILRLYLKLAPWAMAEIFVIGVVVSLVKLGSVATISIGIAFWAMIGFVCVLALISSHLCQDSVWEQLGALEND